MFIRIIKYLVKCIPTGHMAQPYFILQKLMIHHILDGLEKTSSSSFWESLVQEYYVVDVEDIVPRLLNCFVIFYAVEAYYFCKAI